MARTKKTARDLWKEDARTTLTRFRLSQYARWPNWTGPVPDPTDEFAEPSTKRQMHDMTLKNYYHGPLADINGIIKVRLARKVDDVEDAAFMILWESAGHLKAFQESLALTEPFLRGLGLLPEDGGSTRTSPFTTLQYDWGFPIGGRGIGPDGLEGRITLTIMEIPYLKAKGQDRAGWRKILDEGPGSLTSMKEYEFPLGDFQYPRWYSCSEACTYLTPAVDEVETAEEENEMSTAVCYLFQRWSAAGPKLREKEEALFREPDGKERVAKAMVKAMPPVQSWQIERWDVQTAPCCLELCGLLDEKEVGPPERGDECGSAICKLVR